MILQEIYNIRKLYSVHENCILSVTEFFFFFVYLILGCTCRQIFKIKRVFENRTNFTSNRSFFKNFLSLNSETLKKTRGKSKRNLQISTLFCYNLVRKVNRDSTLNMRFYHMLFCMNKRTYWNHNFFFFLKVWISNFDEISKNHVQ